MTDTETKEYEAGWKQADPGEGEQAATQVAAEPAEEASEQPAEAAQDEAAAAPPNTAPETNPTDDIWADAPETLRSAFLEQKSRAERLEHQHKSEEGRVARFQRERDELRKQLGAVNSVAGHEDLEAFMASDEYTKVKSEFGDDLGALFKAFETLAARDKLTTAQLSQLAEERAGDRSGDNLNWLNSNAPGWVELFDREDFNPWLNSRSQSVRDMITRNLNGLVDPAEVKEVYDLFRAHIGPQQELADPPAPQPKNDRKRESQLDAARSVSSRAPIITEPDTDDRTAGWKLAEAEERRAAAHR